MFSEIPLRDSNNDELFKNILYNIKDFIDVHRRKPSFLADNLYEKSLGHLLMLYRNHYKRRFVSEAWRDGRRQRIWSSVFGNMELLM